MEPLHSQVRSGRVYGILERNKKTLITIKQVGARWYDFYGIFKKKNKYFKN